MNTWLDRGSELCRSHLSLTHVRLPQMRVIRVYVVPTEVGLKMKSLCHAHRQKLKSRHMVRQHKAMNTQSLYHHVLHQTVSALHSCKSLPSLFSLTHRGCVNTHVSVHYWWASTWWGSARLNKNAKGRQGAQITHELLAEARRTRESQFEWREIHAEKKEKLKHRPVRRLYRARTQRWGKLTGHLVRCSAKAQTSLDLLEHTYKNVLINFCFIEQGVGITLQSKLFHKKHALKPLHSLLTLQRFYRGYKSIQGDSPLAEQSGFLK